MKYILTVILVLCLTITTNAQEESHSETTVYYLIRHAEKDRSDKSNRNPDLTEAGKTRAENWSNVFNQIKFDAIYSTEYNRTLQTATPTAESQGLKIQTYDPRQLKFDDFAKATKGKVVLIVGHSNTTPMFANAILEKQKYQFMDDNDNGSLFIITVSGDQKVDQVLSIN